MIFQKFKAFSILLFLVVLTLVFSCNKSAEIDQEFNTDLSEKAAFDLLKDKIIKGEKEIKFNEVDEIDGKTAAELYQEWEQSNNNDVSTTSCDGSLNCPKINFSSTIPIDTNCLVQYSCQAYLCSFGNIVIYNLEFSSAGNGSCPRYDLMLQALQDGDIELYQKIYNKIASTILSYIEDILFSWTSNTGLSQYLIASYIPNLCYITCDDNGEEVEEECGNDCCLRFAVYYPALKTRTTSVSSLYECGIGETSTCSTNGQMVDCKNYLCPNLDLYVEF